MPNQFKYPNYTPDIFMLFSYQVNQWSTAESIYVSKLYTKHLYAFFPIKSIGAVVHYQTNPAYVRPVNENEDCCSRFLLLESIRPKIEKKLL